MAPYDAKHPPPQADLQALQLEIKHGVSTAPQKANEHSFWQKWARKWGFLLSSGSPDAKRVERLYRTQWAPKLNKGPLTDRELAALPFLFHKLFPDAGKGMPNTAIGRALAVCDEQGRHRGEDCIKNFRTNKCKANAGASTADPSPGHALAIAYGRRSHQARQQAGGSAGNVTRAHNAAATVLALSDVAPRSLQAAVQGLKDADQLAAFGVSADPGADLAQAVTELQAYVKGRLEWAAHTLGEAVPAAAAQATAAPPTEEALPLAAPAENGSAAAQQGAAAAAAAGPAPSPAHRRSRAAAQQQSAAAVRGRKRAAPDADADAGGSDAHGKREDSSPAAKRCKRKLHITIGGRRLGGAATPAMQPPRDLPMFNTKENGSSIKGQPCPAEQGPPTAAVLPVFISGCSGFAHELAAVAGRALPQQQQQPMHHSSGGAGRSFQHSAPPPQHPHPAPTTIAAAAAAGAHIAGAFPAGTAAAERCLADLHEDLDLLMPEPALLCTFDGLGSKLWDAAIMNELAAEQPTIFGGAAAAAGASAQQQQAASPGGSSSDARAALQGWGATPPNSAGSSSGSRPGSSEGAWPYSYEAMPANGQPQPAPTATAFAPAPQGALDASDFAQDHIMMLPKFELPELGTFGMF